MQLYTSLEDLIWSLSSSVTKHKLNSKTKTWVTCVTVLQHAERIKLQNLHYGAKVNKNTAYLHSVTLLVLRGLPVRENYRKGPILNDKL